MILGRHMWYGKGSMASGMAASIRHEFDPMEIIIDLEKASCIETMLIIHRGRKWVKLNIRKSEGITVEANKTPILSPGLFYM